MTQAHQPQLVYRWSDWGRPTRLDNHWTFKVSGGLIAWRAIHDKTWRSEVKGHIGSRNSLAAKDKLEVLTSNLVRISFVLRDSVTDSRSLGHMPEIETWWKWCRWRPIRPLRVNKSSSYNFCYTELVCKLLLRLINISLNILILLIWHVDRSLYVEIMCNRCAVFGCPTVRGTSEYWYRRDGDSLVVGCNSSTSKWYLVCKNQRWLGEVGNCSNTLTGQSCLLYECSVPLIIGPVVPA